jgi:hypothetical protein
LPERILEEIDGDESLSGPGSDDKIMQSDNESNNNDDKLKGRKYDFLYKRTCFRLMVDFFKTLFKQMFQGKKVSRNY